MDAASSRSALNSSALSYHGQELSQFFKEFIAQMISLLVGTSVLISRSTAASWMFGATVGGSLFKSSLKCSTQRISCSHSDVSKVLFLSSFGNQFYTVPCSLCMAASSARDARFSMYFHLSALARSFTSLFAALHIS